MIDLCLDRVTAEEIAELRRRFDAMAAPLVGDRFVDFHGYLDANYAFHEYLVSLARNPLLTATFGKLSIKSVMTRSFGSTPESSPAVHRGTARPARRVRRPRRPRRPRGRRPLLRARQGPGAGDPGPGGGPALDAGGGAWTHPVMPPTPPGRRLRR